MTSPSPMLLAGDALRGDIRTEFLDTLKRRAAQSVKLPELMELGTPSTQRVENYFYWESVPIPVRWRRGDDIPAQGIRSRSYSVENFTWARAIDWHEEDQEDDQTGSLTSQAQSMAGEFALLPERVAFQVLLGSADPDLLPTVPLAPDGVAMFSATDGAGANRFGVTGGNLLTGTGVATSAAIRADFFSAIERMIQFQGTNGEPFHAENIADAGFLVIYGAQNEQRFREAFQQRTVADTGPGSTTAGVGNVILEGGLAVKLWSTARLAGSNDWYVIALGYDVKPLFRQVRLQITTDEQNRSNSDRARDTRMSRFQAFARFGFGVNLPIGSVKVNN
ncbi:MAG TPA: Mu-like prophage major head subunit gpT family protein [Phycisphaerae bacterium]|nr:Mu-like prophage major head subunit gpT family protein [Phycisphaerae bacterium]